MNNVKKQYAAIVFGYGQKEDGTADDQTQNRCLKAITLYKKNTIDKIYLVMSASKVGVAMADAMRDFLVQHGVSGSDIVVDRRGGNTAGELSVFLSHVTSDQKLLLISSWYHIPRITWTAMWIMPLSRFRVGVDWNHLYFKDGDVRVEMEKLLTALLKPRGLALVYGVPPPIQTNL